MPLHPPGVARGEPSPLLSPLPRASRPPLPIPHIETGQDAQFPKPPHPPFPIVVGCALGVASREPTIIDLRERQADYRMERRPSQDTYCCSPLPRPGRPPLPIPHIETGPDAILNHRILRSQLLLGVPWAWLDGSHQYSSYISSPWPSILHSPSPVLRWGQVLMQDIPASTAPVFLGFLLVHLVTRR